LGVSSSATRSSRTWWVRPAARVQVVEVLRVKAMVTAALILAFVGCAGSGTTGPRKATRSFYAAVAAGNGRLACASVSRATREALEEEEQQSCPRAILNAQLDVSGAQVRHVDTAMTGAAVQLTNGQYVFLDRSSGRWEISAAGCKPAPDQSPFDCSLED
jgi:hypothetical protein